MTEKKEYVKPAFQYWPAEELDQIVAQMSCGSGGTPPLLVTLSPCPISTVYGSPPPTFIAEANKPVNFEFCLDNVPQPIDPPPPPGMKAEFTPNAVLPGTYTVKVIATIGIGSERSEATCKWIVEEPLEVTLDPLCPISTVYGSPPTFVAKTNKPAEFVFCLDDEPQPPPLLLSDTEAEFTPYEFVPVGPHTVKVIAKSGSEKDVDTCEWIVTCSQLTVIVDPDIPPLGSQTATPTRIPDLPVELLDQNDGVLQSKKTDTDGTVTFDLQQLPSTVSALKVRLVLDDNEIAVRDRSGGAQVYTYPVPEKYYDGLDPSVSTCKLHLSTEISTDQEKACLCIWRHAKKALVEYDRIGSITQLPELFFKYTDGVGTNTDYAGNTITLSGVYDPNPLDPKGKDWFDYDVIAHEMGHWIMDCAGGFPLFHSGGHNFSEPSNPGLAYSEGWAGYFSSVIRESSEFEDYLRPAGPFYGCNLSNATIHYLDWSSEVLSLDDYYAQNKSYELNVAIVLWNLKSPTRGYLFAENIMSQGGWLMDFQQYYNKYMAALPASERLKAWDVFESRRCAFDMDVPDIISLEVDSTGYNLVLSATDNVGIARVEWYVNGRFHSNDATINGEPSVTVFLNLSSLGLTPGQYAVVACRVYDFEGVQALVEPPLSRPRRQRFTAGWKLVTIPGVRSPVSPLTVETPFEYDPYMDKNMQKILQEDLLMAMGDSVTLHADLDGSEDLLLFANVFFGRDITVRKPDGSVSLHTNKNIDDIFDHPLVIPVNEAGTWSVTATMMTDEELYEEMLAYTPEGLLHKDAPPPQFCSLLLASSPAAVEMELPEVTTDPYLLARIVANMPGTVVATENEERLSLSQPLADGMHRLIFQRVTSDRRVSEVTHHDLIVDTLAPEIMLGDFERETNFPYVLLTLRVSDNVKDLYINEKLWNAGSRRLVGEILESVPLEMGANHIELRAVSFAGYETMSTMTVTRQGEMPEYVEMDGYWLHYYYREDGTLVEEWIHGESDPRSSMK